MKVRVTIERLDDSGNVVESRAVLRSFGDDEGWVTNQAPLVLANVINSDEADPAEFVACLISGMNQHTTCLLPDAFLSLSQNYVKWVCDIETSDPDFDKWLARRPPDGDED